jgi:uncharacterized protein
MNCPLCNVQLLMMERLATQIDYCPQCRGIWLEKGKLDKIIERASTEKPKPAIPQSHDHYPPVRGYEHHDKHQDDHYGEHRKKRSFLHDLFD